MEIKKFESKVWLASPYIHEEERKYVKEAFDTNWMSTVGANINELEKNICDYTGCGNALALSSGTAALHLAVKMAGVEQGDIVLCTDMTFSATVNPVVYEKAVPVFIDSERETWNMDPRVLEKALIKYKGKVKAVIVAELYGTPAKNDEIENLCKQYGVPLIEDAAESLGASYKGRMAGALGDINVISFNGNKIITGTSGGMLLSDDKSLIDHARKLSTQARDDAPWYQHSEIGYNYRMSNLIAGVARGQLEHLGEHLAGKKAIWERYAAGFEGLPVQMNPWEEWAEPNYWLSCFTIDEDAFAAGFTPEKIRTTLLDYNAESRSIWKPMHMQPVFADCDYIQTGEENICEDIFRRGLCLPSDLNMTADQQDTIIEIVRSLYNA